MKLISIMKSSYSVTHIQELALLMNIYKNINELDIDKLEKSFKRWVKSLQQDDTNNAFKIYCIDAKGDLKCLRKNSNVKDRAVYTFHINQSSEFDYLMNDVMQIQESTIKFIEKYIN